MDTAIDCLNHITDAFKQAKTEYKSCSKQLSMLDLETQDILHAIENEVFNAARGYCMAKQLKDIRIRRRAVKRELELFQVLISNLEGIDFEKITQKLNNKVRQHEGFTYSPRVLKRVD